MTDLATRGGFGFTGEQVDPETGFVYLRNRCYDPATSRFLTPDPLGMRGSGVNLYAYVGNNPATLTDPSGLACPECPGSGGGVGGGAGGPGGGGFDGAEPPIVRPADGFVEPELPEDFIGPRFPVKAPQGAGAFGPAGEGDTFCPKTEGPDAGGPQDSSPNREPGAAGVPQKAFDTYDFLKEHNWTPPRGYKGGSVFSNRNGDLPPGGNYREYDIDPRPAANTTGRNDERVVVDINTGKAWYSSNHYGDVQDGNPPFVPMN